VVLRSGLGFDEEPVIVSPDVGRVKTARNFADKVGCTWAVMGKSRPAQQVAEISYLVGEVEGKTAVLVDDMIDTAGTLCAAASTVLEKGAARVIACATHGVFSAAPGRTRQHHRSLHRPDAGRLDSPDLQRRLGLRDLRGREPTLLNHH
jgi:ribose-phosphate pyrophosphokinase